MPVCICIMCRTMRLRTLQAFADQQVRIPQSVRAQSTPHLWASTDQLLTQAAGRNRTAWRRACT